MWVSVNSNTRDKLREIFKIPRTSHAEVITDSMGKGTVVCDGTSNVDLQELTVEKMIDFLGTAAIDETIYDLFKKVVEKIETPELIESTTIELKPSIEPINASSDVLKEEQTIINVNKCPDCEYTHASKQGLRMHIYKKHTKK